jgi:tripartite ATP-independent transporter DctP family solute receptor
MSLSLRTFASLLAAFAVALGAGAALAQEKIQMKIATVAPDNTPWSELLKRYKKAVEEKSGGRIEVKVFLGGVLGDENESVLKCHRNQIQAVGASTGAVASKVPEINIIEVPYLFRSPEEADHVIDTVLTEPLGPIFRKYGLVLGFWSENGFRQFGSSKKFIKAPADLQGQKMRSQESPIHLEMWKAFGASPQPIPTTEVLTALQTGTVDGFDQATLFTVAASWFKTIKYYTVSDHMYQPAMIIFNQEWFDKLTPDLQKILLDEGRALQAKGRKAVRKILPDLLAIMKASGVEVYELTAAEKQSLEAAAKPVRDYVRANQGAEAAKLLDLVEKAVAEYRAGKK